MTGTFNNADPDCLPHIRQSVAGNLHQAIRSAEDSWLFAYMMVEAITNKIWAHPRQDVHGELETLSPAMPLLEWITAPYPRGLGTTVGTVERILDACGDEGAKAAWERAVQGQPAGEKGLRSGPLDRVKAEWYRCGPALRAGIGAWIKAAHGSRQPRKLMPRAGGGMMKLWPASPPR